MLMVGNTLMRARPDWAHVSLDFSNAVGTVSRAAMLRGTSEWRKGHCGFLVDLWSAPHWVWIEVAPNVWECVQVKDGACQGDTSSSPSFSRAMRRMERVVRDEATLRCIPCEFASLHDDMLAFCPPERVDELVAIIAAVAKDVGKLSLNSSKCCAHVPAWVGQVEAREYLANKIQSVQVNFDGLPALGSAYAGDFEAVLGHFSVQAEPARNRLQTARKIVEECKEMACSKHDTASKQAIWCLLQKSVARALQYDVRF